jgi:hypothetical protein
MTRMSRWLRVVLVLLAATVISPLAAGPAQAADPPYVQLVGPTGLRVCANLSCHITTVHQSAMTDRCMVNSGGEAWHLLYSDYYGSFPGAVQVLGRAGFVPASRIISVPAVPMCTGSTFTSAYAQQVGLRECPLVDCKIVGVVYPSNQLKSICWTDRNSGREMWFLVYVIATGQTGFIPLHKIPSNPLSPRCY